MEFITENKELILGIIGGLFYLSIYIPNFLTAPNAKRLTYLQNVIYLLIVEAEKEFGGGTGLLKFKGVLTNFIKGNRILSVFIPESSIEKLIQKIFDIFKNDVEKNKNIAIALNMEV